MFYSIVCVLFALFQSLLKSSFAAVSDNRTAAARMMDGMLVCASVPIVGLEMSIVSVHPSGLVSELDGHRSMIN